jgi:hypothetical protein
MSVTAIRAPGNGRGTDIGFAPRPVPGEVRRIAAKYREAARAIAIQITFRAPRSAQASGEARRSRIYSDGLGSGLDGSGLDESSY